MCSHVTTDSRLGPGKPFRVHRIGTSELTGKSQYPMIASTDPSNESSRRCAASMWSAGVTSRNMRSPLSSRGWNR